MTSPLAGRWASGQPEGTSGNQLAYEETMKAGAIVLAVLMLLTGGVWIGQGLGYIKGSFMTGDMKWFWIGVGMIAAGVVLGVGALRGRQSRV